MIPGISINPCTLTSITDVLLARVVSVWEQHQHNGHTISRIWEKSDSKEYCHYPRMLSLMVCCERCQPTCQEPRVISCPAAQLEWQYHAHYSVTAQYICLCGERWAETSHQYFLSNIYFVMLLCGWQCWCCALVYT